jgi:hypothetical protein
MTIVKDYYSFVVEIERDGVRMLYGPFSNSKDVEAYAERHKDHSEKVMIRGVFRASNEPSVHSNQTTINDHITDIHDHVG